MQKQKITIIGNGQFGKFIKPHLEKHFEVEIYGRNTSPSLSSRGEGQNKIETDFLIFAVPLNSLEEVCKTFENKISEKTILVDVTSVKVKPLEIIEKYFPKDKFQILGTHPMFGPQSGASGLKNLQIVLSNISLVEEKYFKIRRFLEESLELRVLEKTAEEHDREIAYVQGLSHFVGAALAKMEIPEFEMETQSYKKLLELKNLISEDSWELYKTIQNGNPSTKNIRKKFLDELKKLEEDLENEN